MSTNIDAPVPRETPDVRDVAAGTLIQRAREGDGEAITTMFRQFIPQGEQIVAVEYLGAIGLIFKTYSFACVTPRRVASLLVKPGGQITYRDGIIESINSAVLHQPSRFGLGAFILGLVTFQFLTSWRAANRTTVGLVLSVGEGLSIPIVTHRKRVTRANSIYRSILETRERRLSVGALNPAP